MKSFSVSVITSLWNSFGGFKRWLNLLYFDLLINLFMPLCVYIIFTSIHLYIMSVFVKHFGEKTVRFVKCFK